MCSFFRRERERARERERDTHTHTDREREREGARPKRRETKQKRERERERVREREQLPEMAQVQRHFASTCQASLRVSPSDTHATHTSTHASETLPKRVLERCLKALPFCMGRNAWVRVPAVLE